MIFRVDRGTPPQNAEGIGGREALRLSRRLRYSY
jgi:hypothetical protein